MWNLKFLKHNKSYAFGIEIHVYKDIEILFELFHNYMMELVNIVVKKEIAHYDEWKCICKRERVKLTSSSFCYFYF